MQQLRGVVPFVQGFTLLQPVIALQADQLPLQRNRQRLGQFSFTDTRLAFEQQGALQFQRQKHGGSQTAVSKVASVFKRLLERVDARERDHGLIIDCYYFNSCLRTY